MWKIILKANSQAQVTLKPISCEEYNEDNMNLLAYAVSNKELLFIHL